MSGSKAGIRYAKAVLQQANSANNATEVFNDMQAVAATLSGSKELRNVLQSPVIKLKDKKEALLTIFDKEGELTKSLINVLADNKRIAKLGEVADSYINIYNEAKGIKVAKVTTAVALSEALEQQVLAKVKEMTGSTNVTLENEIDPDIIGGFVLRVGDLQYNASIANQLSNLKREFSKSL
ncbi:ATP synthase F1 subcomplex delta subunit [Ulvibacter sp. MAR_2010_11]|uniref:ATP synthase F1 subunit delta n=1 Tax=Ulvibacter sp. MAR_2010_11 TaxID=1250229 RepID=UPI000C2C2EC1|nr:ATP synthase F1 subunit delta [Ulvibacter sp. MAR_2010_11]PKA82892.1 ATP synthase F1 subcomplex delta subunit [Ulvibacter sp. MAR_2010_11]